MRNRSITNTIANLEGNASEDLMTRIEILRKKEKVLGPEKVKRICALLYMASTSFASGAILLSEAGITESFNKGNLSEENAQLSRILLRQMFSARDGENSKGKENYKLLLILLKVLCYPGVEFKGDFTALMIKESSKYESFELLGRTIRTSFKSRKKGAVMCAVIEYYTPMFIELLRYAYDFGLSENHNRINKLNKDKGATLYIENHNGAKDTYLGHHVFRSLLRESEYSVFEHNASEIVIPFVAFIKEMEAMLLITTEKGKM